MQPMMCYFQRRGLGLMPQWPTDLRFHPNCYNFTSKSHHPAMVAAIRDVLGKVTAVHQTFLTPDGQKIEGDTVRPKLVCGTMKGGTIRLADASQSVALCEGIEDALSIRIFTGWPCWAYVSASNTPDLPESIRTVMLCGDNDEAGRNAVNRLARQYRSEGRSVQIAYPPQGFKDFNAALMGESINAI